MVCSLCFGGKNYSAGPCSNSPKIHPNRPTMRAYLPTKTCFFFSFVGEIWESLALTSHNISHAKLPLQILWFAFFLPSLSLASRGRADGKLWCHQPWRSGIKEQAEPQGATIGAHVFVPCRWWNRWCGAARLCCTCVPACWLISLVMWNVTICSPVPLTPSCVNANHWQEDSYLSHVKSGAWRWAICQPHLKSVAGIICTTACLTIKGQAGPRRARTKTFCFCAEFNQTLEFNPGSLQKLKSTWDRFSYLFLPLLCSGPSMAGNISGHRDWHCSW